MSTIDEYPPGRFCWTDLSAKDMASASDFYGELFGWQPSLQPSHGGPPYAQFTLRGRAVAGVGQMSDEMLAAGAPTVWNSYVSVADCAASQAEAVALGAEVVFDTMEVRDAGWLCYLKDPTGAIFALWQPGLHCGAGLRGEPGAPAYHELATPELSAAKAFYGALFGWVFGPGDGFCAISAGGEPSGHIVQMTAAWAGIPPHWGVYFAVADADDAAARAQALGGKVCVPPTDIPTGRFSVLEDRAGAIFSIIQLS